VSGLPADAPRSDTDVALDDIRAAAAKMAQHDPAWEQVLGAGDRKTDARTARLSIRRKTYRGEDGFLVYGRDGAGRQVSIFTTTRGSAEHIRERVKAGQQTTLDDFEPRELAAGRSA
jgi:hypothetical protein